LGLNTASYLQNVINLVSIAEQHIRIFGDKPEGVFRAPGRVNLIGEHTDYNNGFVLPTPINRYLKVSAKKRLDKKLNLYAIDFDEKTQHRLDNLIFDKKNLWTNYILGVAYALQKRDLEVGGLDICITGDVPIGAGLSSSAALETAVTRSFNELFNLELGPVDIAYIGKECENDFVGIQSGIMDQFVSSIGEIGKALFIDCKSNEYSLHDLSEKASVVIVNSMMDRSLATSEYNIRHAQCIEAVKVIKKKYPNVNSLRDVSEDMLLEQWHNLPELIARRARHVITENQRVLESVELLEKGDMFGFGEFMYESHDSLRHDYEVSSKHLDFLVDFTMDLDGVLGARLTGAGFGGCTVNLVEAEYVEEFSQIIAERYFKRTAKKCEIYLD
jgi:galactokinase